MQGLFAAARTFGISNACIETSIKYAKERIQFGRFIGEFQLINTESIGSNVYGTSSRKTSCLLSGDEQGQRYS
uniref:Acyl-CoA dehydrogenase/oxidase C-terminal domain-containing protein n=1 Tax=candidate division WOR-3 bacterium TaxID=2052148 RepID=A0A7C2K583_UNCW3